MSQVIAFVSGKGGTGKTSCTALIGASLAEMGKRTLCIDCDVGLRNLDLALGLSDSALMDFTDVISARATLEQAAVRHPKLRCLYLLTAPVRLDNIVRPEDMKRLLADVREQFDFCLIDAPAGLGEIFRLAVAGADRAIVVSTAEPTSLRDAQRTVMELQDFPAGRLHLVVNRVSKHLLRSLHANIDDAMDAAGLPLLGVVPEDEIIPSLLGRGLIDRFGHYSGSLHAGRTFTRQLFGFYSDAVRACYNIALRLNGERVPLMKL